MIGTRLGVGLILHGDLHRGVHGAAGEIGEIPELGWNTAAENLAAGTPCAGSVDRDTAAQAVFQSAREGDRLALDAVDTFVEKVARGLIPVILTIDPSAVVVGGSFIDAADLVLPRLNERIHRSCVRAPILSRSSFGDDAVGLGAIRLALETVLTSITNLDSSMPLTPANVLARLADDSE